MGRKPLIFNAGGQRRGFKKEYGAFSVLDSDMENEDIYGQGGATMLDTTPSNPTHSETENAPWVPAKALRKASRVAKRREHQAERARIKEHLQMGLHDPELFLDLEGSKKNERRKLESGAERRQALLASQLRKVKSELANTRDLDGFIAKASRSRTLHTLVAMAFFRQVQESEEYREDHRFKAAIRKALEEPGLARSIQHRWGTFDREYHELPRSRAA
jgi:hypothetical protein